MNFVAFLSDNDDYKHWQFRLVLPTTNFTKVDATLESVDEDGDLVKVIGDVIFDGELPIYLSKKLNLPHELTSLSGKLSLKSLMIKTMGFKLNLVIT